MEAVERIVLRLPGLSCAAASVVREGRVWRRWCVLAWDKEEDHA